MKRWIHAATDVSSDGTIQQGLVWHDDGFEYTIVSVSADHKTCKVQESWISEDTGKRMRKTFVANIAQDDNGSEFFYDPEYENYAFNDEEPEGYSWWARKYAESADNYPYEETTEDDYEEDDYTSSFGDYSPSNPWDAPGMSKSDFV